MKLYQATEKGSARRGHFMFMCPACGFAHSITVGPDGWQWNGDRENPTITPSIRAYDSDGLNCHSYITDGKIAYLSDCSHDMKGKTVELPEWEDWPESEKP